jgi:hypothetical protein
MANCWTSRGCIIIVLLVVVCVYVLALIVDWPQRAAAVTTDYGLTDRKMRWPYTSLIIFGVLCVGPSLIAPIAYLLSSTVDISGLIGRPDRPPDLIALLLYPFFFFLPFWPFLALYDVTRKAVTDDPSAQKSIRLAMIVSTVAMALPSLLFWTTTPAEMMSSARDAGQGTGIIAFFYAIFLPFPGILGWFVGRGIAWILWR